jgi:hypothetical protein
MSRQHTPTMQKQTRYRPPYRTCVTKINLNTIAEESVDSQDEMESFIFQTEEIDDYYQSAAKIAEAIGLRKTRAKRDPVSQLNRHSTTWRSRSPCAPKSGHSFQLCTAMG